MAEWEKEIAELKTDVKYIREDVSIMQKQIRDLNKHTNMGPVTTNPVLSPVPVGGITPTTTGTTPFNINQFYASLPQYTQQGIMAPTNLSRFTDALKMFPGMA